MAWPESSGSSTSSCLRTSNPLQEQLPDYPVTRFPLSSPATPLLAPLSMTVPLLCCKVLGWTLLLRNCGPLAVQGLVADLDPAIHFPPRLQVCPSIISFSQISMSPLPWLAVVCLCAKVMEGERLPIRRNRKKKPIEAESVKLSSSSPRRTPINLSKHLQDKVDP